MSRTLTSRNQTEVAKTGTQPVLVFELGFDPTLRLCTYDDVGWNGYVWSLAPVRLGQLQATEGGGQVGAIELSNLDNTYSAVVLNQGARGKSCKIWQLYGDAPYAAGDGVALFSGVMGAVPSLEDVVRIEIATTGVAVLRCPRHTLAPWLGGDMTPPGTRIVWAGEIFTLEARDG